MEVLDFVDVANVNLDGGGDSVLDLLDSSDSDEVVVEEDQPPTVEDEPPTVEDQPPTVEEPKETSGDEEILDFLDPKMALSVAMGVGVAGLVLYVGQKVLSGNSD